MEHGLLTQLLVVLTVGTLAVAVCQRQGLSPILGYLATGVLIGPSSLGWLTDGPTTRQLAELGVVLLMFTVGLEFSLPRLLAAKRLILGLGGAQVVLTAVLLGLAGWGLGVSAGGAVVLGGALAMSSTAIVLKQLGEQMELPAAHGRVAAGVLLFQDIAAVPFLAVLPVLAAGQPQLGVSLGLALAKAALVFGGLVWVGRRLLPPILHWVATSRSLELFMLTALLLAVAAAGASALAGLSATLGAFMAGMLLGETLFRHQIEADIRPFRDLMLGLFFVTIGMQLDPATFVDAPFGVLLVLVGLPLVKAGLLVPLIRAFGQTKTDAWRGAISLAPGGEFGLLLVSSALALGLLDSTQAQPVLAGLALSMLAAPILVRFNGRLASLLATGPRERAPVEVEAHIAEASSGFSEHVIVCGYGRVGQNLMRVLEQERVPALALDLDPERISQALAAGAKVLYGNAAQPGVLRAAGVDRARALAISVDDAALAERIVSHLRATGSQLPILVRSVHGHNDGSLTAAGAEVFPEGLEASLAFAGQLLILLGIAPSRVETRLNSIRADDYAALRVFFHDSGESGSDVRDYPQQARALIVHEGHYAAGRTPQELGLAERGVELTDVRRGAIRVPGRLLDTRLRPGDVLVLKGTSEAIERAAACVTEGGC